MEKPEHILCSAIDYHFTIVCGRRHSDCYDIIKNLYRMYTGKPTDPDDLPDRDKQGFLTSRNRFVSRKEAFVIAKTNNQFCHNIHDSDDEEENILISEDLYYP